MIILWVIIAISFGFIAGWLLRQVLGQKKLAKTSEYAAKLIDEAKIESENLKREKLLEAKEANFLTKQKIEQELNSKQREAQRLEKQLGNRELNLDRKVDILNKKENELNQLTKNLNVSNFICSDAKKLEPSSCRQEKNAFPEKSFTQEERASIRNVDSVWVRAYLKQDIAERLGIDPLRLQIIRPAKQNKIYPPFLLIDHKRASMDISLSHHGRWAAWAYSVPRHHFEDCRRSLSVPAI